MADDEKSPGQQEHSTSGRRSFFYTVFGGILAAVAGWISGAFPNEAEIPQEADSAPTSAGSRISALEAEVARLAGELLNVNAIQPIAQLEGDQGLAFLRDWRFTAALWDEDGKLLLGRLHPHPPANEPAEARLHVRGTLDEVQTIIEGSASQAADIFQVVGGQGTTHFAVNSSGNVVVGSQDDPKQVILHDTVDGSAYSLKVTNGQLALLRD